MISNRSDILRIRACFLASACLIGFSTPTRGAAVWSLGHGDIGVAFVSGTTFELELHVGEGATVDGSEVTTPGGIAYEPNGAVIGVPGTANLKAIQSGSTAVWAGDTAGYNFITTGSSLGVAQGGNLWVLSYDESDTEAYGTPFLGWATEEGFLGQTFGDVVFTPFSFSSPTGGNFGIFQDNLSPLWLVNHGDTTFDGDTFSVPANTHTHKVLAFTQPGIYSIGIQATSLLSGTTTVVGQGVYTFQVVPEPSSIALAGLGAAGALAAGWRRRRRAAAANSAFAEAAR